MRFVNRDGTSEKATAEDLLRMAGVAKPDLEPCTIPEALETIESVIDLMHARRVLVEGNGAKEDPLAGMLTPIHRLLLRLQIDCPGW